MSATALLQEMIELTRAQIDHVIAGDVKALTDGAAEQERLLRELQTAEIDAEPEEIRRLHDELRAETNRLSALLHMESGRVDFLLRLLLGGNDNRDPGYPSGKARGGTFLNRRA
ncbi:hypothetical protein [Symbiobacterium terraclitae]|uniref:hypothetical protein n=1 Tax=Symbiobacterium terraclitae TaxID=557451 RepID=UPI0035B55059